ncbi:ClpXP adapter SpxH family protein [Bacillaceae bacterium S4-13-58]
MKNSGTSGQGNQTNTQYGFFDLLKKPVEVYVFIDPLCPECWSLEPILKKLTIEYGKYFTLRPIVSGKLTHLNAEKLSKPSKLAQAWEKTANRTGMSCDGDVWLENPIDSPWLASLSIKAAELQGRKAGVRFLRKLQEYVFLKKKNISDSKVLVECASESCLDVEEFSRDLQSTGAKKALQCDLKLTQEMNVDQIPAIVLFNQLEEQDGIKVTGIYPYDVYVDVLKEILAKKIIPSKKPPLEEFLQHYRFVASKEISVVYDWSEAETEKEMKKLLLLQKVEKVPVKHGTFWRYVL